MWLIGPKIAGDLRIQGHLTATSESRALRVTSLSLASAPAFKDFHYGKQNHLVCFKDQQSDQVSCISPLVRTSAGPYDLFLG